MSATREAPAEADGATAAVGSEVVVLLEGAELEAGVVAGVALGADGPEQAMTSAADSPRIARIFTQLASSDARQDSQLVGSLRPALTCC
jgi:hypothetical protein